MFTYWPWVGLISVLTLFVMVLVLKFGDKMCGARLVVRETRTKQPEVNMVEVDQFEMVEGGSVMEFGLQQADESLADYSPSSQQAGRREFAL